MRLNEHRYYQVLNVRLLDRDGVTLDSRTRFKHRTFEEGEGTSWRLRDIVQLRVQVSKKQVRLPCAGQQAVCPQPRGRGSGRPF